MKVVETFIAEYCVSDHLNECVKVSVKKTKFNWSSFTVCDDWKLLISLLHITW